MPIKTLLVEDNPADARMVRDLLAQAAGRQVILKHAFRLGGALQDLEAEKPDVVVLDLSLPDSKGLATFRRIHSQDEAVPIVVLTGLDDAEVAAQAIAEGAADYLLKSELSGDFLLRALRYAIERQRAETALRQTQRELAVKNQVAHVVLITPDDRMYGEVLRIVLEFTRSREGIFGYLDSEGALVCAAAGSGDLPRSGDASMVRVPPAGWTGLWGEALREKRAVCSCPAKAEKPAEAVRHALAVPLCDADWAIGVLSVAGRKAEYTDSDREFLESLAAYLAPGVHARMQRDAHEKMLASALAAKEVLLREVHHRVKNNLQIIASLLNMQADTLPDSFRMALDESQRRVRSMALVHEQLYSCERPDQLNFGDYVASLTQDLFAAYSVRTSDVRLLLDIDAVVLDVDHAVPCGLILNELVTNSLKHAFPEGRAGEIHVGLHCRENQVALRVADNGVGLAPGYDPERAESLGLRIVNILTTQLSGTLTCARDAGAAFTLTFAKG